MPKITEQMFEELTTVSDEVYNEMTKQMLYVTIKERGMRIHQLEKNCGK